MHASVVTQDAYMLDDEGQGGIDETSLDFALVRVLDDEALSSAFLNGEMTNNRSESYHHSHLTEAW